jgi:pyruvate formate lyase activating enzyme
MPSTLDNRSQGSVEGTILRIERYAIHDGPGIRAAVFFKGCPLRCAWCHSPESQQPWPEFMPQAERCLGCGACTEACPDHACVPAAIAVSAAPPGCTTCGSCAEACPALARQLVGSTCLAEEVVSLVERDRIFFDESGGGVTFSGGEPLMQGDFLVACARRCRELGIDVTVETCGMGDSEALVETARFTNLFLFDLKTLDDEVHRSVTGASNRPILANLERLAAIHGNVVVRYPLVPGVNSSDREVLSLGALLPSLGIRRVALLPYHRAGISKYRRLFRPYGLDAIELPSKAFQDHAARCLEGFGLEILRGGSS